MKIIENVNQISEKVKGKILKVFDEIHTFKADVHQRF
jgi:hypothetical protein